MAYTKTTWQDLPNTTTPINATNLNKIENGIEAIDNDVSAINNNISTINNNIGDLSNLETSDTSSLVNAINSITPKVLWENSNITTNFAAQTVTLSEPIENFRYYTAIFIHSTDNTFLVSGISKPGYGMRVHTDGWAIMDHRDITNISGTSCTFSDDKEFPTYGGNERVANQRLIPFQIIGQY